jgi:hypothetical protein
VNASQVLRKMPPVTRRDHMLMPLRWLVGALSVGLKLCSKETYRPHLCGVNLQISTTTEDSKHQHLIAYATDGHCAVEFAQRLPAHYQGQHEATFYIHRDEAVRVLAALNPVVAMVKRSAAMLYEYDNLGPGSRAPNEPTLAVSIATKKGMIVYPSGMMRVGRFEETPPSPASIARIVRRPGDWKAGGFAGIDVSLLERALSAARAACPAASGRRGNRCPWSCTPAATPRAQSTWRTDRPSAAGSTSQIPRYASP